MYAPGKSGYHRNMTLEHGLNEALASAVQRHRERLNISQSELGRRMKEAGYAWHQMTVARTESAERPVRLDEAVTLAQILHIDLATVYEARSQTDDQGLALLAEVMRGEEDLRAAEMDYYAATTRADDLQHRAEEARFLADDALQRFHEVVAASDEAKVSVDHAQTLVNERQARLADARRRLSSHQRRRQLASLADGDLVKLTVKDIRQWRIVGNPADGFTYEIVVGDEETVMESQRFATKEEARAAFDELWNRASRAQDVRCVDCREVIPKGRLDAMPDTIICLDCQVKEDGRQVVEPVQRDESAQTGQSKSSRIRPKQTKLREFQEQARRDWQRQVRLVWELFEKSMTVEEIAQVIGEVPEAVEAMIHEAQGGGPG